MLIRIGETVWTLENQLLASAEAEYQALASVTSAVMWVSSLLKDFGCPSPPTMVLCDNQAATHIASNPTFH